MENEKYLDSEGLLFLVQRLNTVFNNKVDKKEGFSLISDAEITRLANVINYDDTVIQSTILSLQNKVQALEDNPYDDTEIRNLITDCQSDIDALKAKIVNWDAAYTHSQSDHAPSNAQENIIETIKVNGEVLAPIDKSVDILIPTKVSDLSDSENYVTTTDVPTKLSEFENDSNFISSIPDEYVTETKLTAKGYLTSYTETDPTVPDWAKAETKPTYTASEVGALPDDTIIPIPDTASVGDAIVVEEVDENGKPIKFSAVSLSGTSTSQIDETELNTMLEEVFV